MGFRMSDVRIPDIRHPLPVSSPEPPTLRSLRTIGSDALLRGFGKLLRFEFGLWNVVRNGTGQTRFFALLVGRIGRSGSGFPLRGLSGVGESR